MIRKYTTWLRHYKNYSIRQIERRSKRRAKPLNVWYEVSVSEKRASWYGPFFCKDSARHFVRHLAGRCDGFIQN